MRSPIKDSRRDFPAPNQYTIQSSLSKVAYSISKKTSANTARTSPGPACYSDPVTTKNWTKGARIGTSQRFKHIKHGLSAKSAMTSPKYAREDDDEKTPFGYDVEESYFKSKRQSSPSFGFSTQSRGFNLK